MPRLNEKNYTSRRITLNQSLAAATTAYEDALYRDEIGEGVGTAIADAKTQISELEGRIKGLDIAWERTQREAAVDAATADQKAADGDYAKIETVLAERATMVANMAAYATALAQQYNEYVLAGRAIINLALNHRTRFTQDRIGHLRDLVDGNFNDIRRPLTRILTTNGLDLSDFSGRGFDSDRPMERDIVAFGEWQNNRIAGHAALLTAAKGS